MSRVINGGNLVAPAIRKRVEAVIRELNFQPSHAARSLKQERTQSIGLVVPRLTDPFFSGIASVAQTVCRAQQHLLMMSTSLDQEEQALEEVKVFERLRVDGLILVPPMSQSREFQEYVRGLSARTVAVDLPVKGGGVSSVQTDNVAAMQRATEHLLEHKRKRILLLVSDPELHTMRERVKGYAAAMDAAGLHLMVRDGLHTLEDVEQAIAAEKIDGLLAANGQLGVMAFEAMNRLGIAMPRDVAFISFDDFALAGLLQPAVTCVAQPLEAIGRAATELLFQMLKEPSEKVKTVRLKSELVVRQSCGCPSP